jgi:hypothetical protein
MEGRDREVSVTPAASRRRSPSPTERLPPPAAPSGRKPVAGRGSVRAFRVFGRGVDPDGSWPGLLDDSGITSARRHRYKQAGPRGGQRQR